MTHKPKARGEPGSGVFLLLDPPLTHGQLTLGSYQPGSQRCLGLKEHAAEAQEVTNQFADATDNRCSHLLSIVPY